MGKIRPGKDLVLLTEESAEVKTSSGLYLAGNDIKKYRVWAANPESDWPVVDNIVVLGGEPQQIKLPVAVEKQLFVVHINDILAVIEEEK